MFDVFLDGKKIGYHRFEIDGSESDVAVVSEASFDVKFLFVTAFSYRHSARENWTGGCLEEIEARTDSNGKELNVVGERTGDSFVIDTGEQEARLPGCVMSFAYWNPRILTARRLLNGQTGELLPVNIALRGEETITVRGEPQAARRHRISGPGLQIDIWLADGRWVALEALVPGGRLLRYELI